MAVERTDGHRGVGALLRDLAGGSADLVRGEVRLARIEVAAAVEGIRTGTLLVATGGVLAVLGGLSLVAGIVMLVGDQWLPRDLYWVAALVVALITAAIAVWMGKRGAAQLSSATSANETVTTLTGGEDNQWLKRRLTSGGISS